MDTEVTYAKEEEEENEEVQEEKESKKRSRQLKVVIIGFQGQEQYPAVF